MQTTNRLSYLALPGIAVAVALVVGSPVLLWFAPVGSAVTGGVALVVGIPALWILRCLGLDRTSVLVGAGGVLGGMSWWLASTGPSPLEVLMPTLIGAATGAIYGVVQTAARHSASTVRTRIIAILVAALLIVVWASTSLPGQWPIREQRIVVRASWSVGPAVDASGAREVRIQVADPLCRVSLFLQELAPFLLTHPSPDVEVELSRRRRFPSMEDLVIMRIGDVNVPYPTSQDVSCR